MSRPTTTETKALALATYAAGTSMKQTAREVGVSESTVHAWVHAAGIARGNGAGKRASAQRRRDEEFGYFGASEFDASAWEVRGGVLRPLFPERRSA